MSAPDLSSLGISLGHATDELGATGLTVVRPTDGVTTFRGAAALPGRATATREIATLAPNHIADRVDAVLLTGGSAYGLDAASGVMRWLEERGRGFAVPGGVVPIVPAAAVFDLVPCGRFDARPTAAMAYAACNDATPGDIAEGSVGVGTGCTVGKAAGRPHAMKGGVGCALEQSGDVSVAAIAAVNAFGDIRDESGRLIAGARDETGRLLDSAALIERSTLGPTFRPAATAHNTTLAVVVTNAALAGFELQALARAAVAAFARRISPSGTSLDGDIVIALAPHSGRDLALARIEVVAVRALERAIERAVRLARGRDGIPGLGDPPGAMSLGGGEVRRAN
ncbi:MAG: P1 family peptidase [Gemmatimonadaceae bacterium]